MFIMSRSSNDNSNDYHWLPPSHDPGSLHWRRNLSSVRHVVVIALFYTSGNRLRERPESPVSLNRVQMNAFITGSLGAQRKSGK